MLRFKLIILNNVYKMNGLVKRINEKEMTECMKVRKKLQDRHGPYPYQKRKRMLVYFDCME